MTGAVCHRELRGMGRYWGTYWLRVLAGLAAGGTLAAVLLVVRMAPLSGSQAAAAVFAALHGVMVLMLALVAPLLPADTLARERRDGTLGLLFLTPLRPADIVAGKCAAQVMRAVMLWLSALPAIAVPVLMGGVGPGNVLWAAALQGGVLLCGLGAGLFATSRARAWGTAMTRAILALVIAAILGAFLVAGVVEMRLHALAPALSELPRGFERLSYPPAVLFGLPLNGVGGAGVLGGMGLGVPRWVLQAGQAGGAAFLAFSVLWFAGAALWLMRVVGRELRAESAPVRRTATPSPADSRWRRPLGVRRPSIANPVVWLQRTSPGAFWAPWAWLVVVLVVWVPLVLMILRWDPHYRYLGWFLPPMLLVALGLAASGSYRREIEEGTLELLLVTTLPPARLVTGRLRVLVGMFLPALVAGWALAGWFNGTADQDWHAWVPLSGLTVTSLVALPLAGLRCALRRVHPLNGWLVTGLWAVAFPALVGGILTVVVAFSDWITRDWPMFWFWSVATALAQLALSGWWGWLCARELADRSFLKRPLAR